MFYLEIVGLVIVAAATYMLQFALLNTGGAFSRDTPAFNAVLVLMVVLFVVYGMVLVGFLLHS